MNWWSNHLMIYFPLSRFKKSSKESIRPHFSLVQENYQVQKISGHTLKVPSLHKNYRFYWIQPYISLNHTRISCTKYLSLIETSIWIWGLSICGMWILSIGSWMRETGSSSTRSCKRISQSLFFSSSVFS